MRLYIEIKLWGHVNWICMCKLCWFEMALNTVNHLACMNSPRIPLCNNPTPWYFLGFVFTKRILFVPNWLLVGTPSAIWPELAKQETLTSPGHLVSPLVCRGPWMSAVVLCYWCHSDSTLVLLYLTLITQLHFQKQMTLLHSNLLQFPGTW